VITGIGGSLLRDLFTGQIPPEAFQRSSPFASVAAIAAAAYVFLVRGLHVQKITAEIAVIVLVVLIRSLAIWRGWSSPVATDLTPKKLRPRSATPKEPHDPADGQDPDPAP
jgi:uncharacterized membrane protein YeiH